MLSEKGCHHKIAQRRPNTQQHFLHISTLHLVYIEDITSGQHNSLGPSIVPQAAA